MGKLLLHTRDKDTKETIAKIITDVLQVVDLKLFKGGRQNGVQRSWFKSGSRRLREPYTDGLLDGVCRQWNERGDLVGKYTMKHGSGTRLAYQDNGALLERRTFEAGGEVGVGIEFLLLQKEISIHWNARPGIGENRVNFRDDGSIAQLISGSGNSRSKIGLIIRFDKDERIVNALFISGGRPASEETYAAARQADRSLVDYGPIKTNPQSIKTPEVLHAFEEFKQLKTVSIPLPDDLKADD